MKQLIADTREPDPHPWSKHLGSKCELLRGWSHPALKKPACLPTADFCLPSAFSYDEATKEVVFRPSRTAERKTLPDFYGVCTASRERFSDELIRILDLRLTCGTETIVVIEALWEAVEHYATEEHGMKLDALRGTVSAWRRRFCPFVFLPDERTAAIFSYHWLTGDVTP